MMDRYETFFAYAIELAIRYQQKIAIGDVFTRASYDDKLAEGDFAKLIKISYHFQEFKMEALDWD